MIDLHCHCLPGVDDGPRTMPEALELAAAFVANGVTTAVLTPHFHPGVFDNRIDLLLPKFVQYKAALAAAGIPLTVHLGGEVRIHPDAFEWLDNDELPLIGGLGGDRLLLLEFPDGQIPPGALQVVRLLADRGVRCLIAHPERNKEVMRDPMRIEPFVDVGCLLQLTEASVIGSFGAPAAKTAHTLLGRGLVAVVASDAHNLRFRPPLLQEARQALAHRYGSGTAYRMTEELPGEIVAGRLDVIRSN